MNTRLVIGGLIGAGLLSAWWRVTNLKKITVSAEFPGAGVTGQTIDGYRPDVLATFFAGRS